ncbi:MAG: hypothetical protein HYX26_03070 [Acidobacteriales bacterium]|nr:hypothetical protein [Terriglobales bacterium]
MISFIRLLRLLSLVLWLGGIFYFAAAVAPNIFGVLSPRGLRALAGVLAGQTLLQLHILALICGGVFLATHLVLTHRVNATENLLTLFMLALTGAQFWIAARIYALTEQGAIVISALPADDPRHGLFSALHGSSAALEIVVFVCGLVVLWRLVNPRDPDAVG